jgi:arylsulfatase A-like enzyme
LRGLVRAAAGALLASSFGGCGEHGTRYEPRADAYLDLAAEHARADRWAEVAVLRITDYSSRAHLARGWSFPETTSKSPYPGVWARSPRPSLLFWITEPGERAISFQVLGGRGRSPRPPNRAKFALNGTPCGEFLIPADRTAVELALPAERQRPGLNELSFEIEGGIRPSVDLDNNEDSRFLTGFFSEPAVSLRDSGQRERAEQRARLVPDGSRVVLEGRAVMQASGSVIRHALEVPPGAAFESEIVVGMDGSGPDSARFLLRLRDDEGTDELLLDEVVARAKGGRRVHGDLGKYAGRRIELELSLESPQDPRAPVRGLWGRPVLLAEPPELAATAPPIDEALRRAREQLSSAPVIVMLLDAFNPDFMTAYGGRAGLTPNLDRLAREGVRFERAFSSAAYTIPAVASILTSRPTWEHGAWSDSTRLSSSVETWGERFLQAGYRTAAVVCTGNGSSAFGYERGFERFVEAFRGLPGGRPFALAGEVVARVDEVLAAGDGRPLMLWLHLLEPHEPYGAREPFGTPLDPDYTGSFRGDTKTIVDIRAWRLQPSVRDVQHLAAQYEEGVAYADHLVGRLRERLEERGLWQDAVVVLLSDHGEAFCAHRSDEYVGLGHNTSTFNDMTRIPLVVRLPEGIGLEPTTSQALVGNIDVFATLADLVGVPLPDGARGTSFAPVLFGAERGGRGHLVVHSSSYDSERFLPDMALMRGTYKYAYSTRWGEALYDLSRSVFEAENLAQAKPVLTAVMRQELRRELGFDFKTGPQRAPPSQPTDIDEETRNQIEALGYVGGTEEEAAPEHQEQPGRKQAADAPASRTKPEE